MLNKLNRKQEYKYGYARAAVFVIALLFCLALALGCGGVGLAEGQHAISITNVSGATITTDPPDEAESGTPVTVYINDIATGKQFDSITVTDANSNPVTIETVTLGAVYILTMPAIEVTISVRLATDQQYFDFYVYEGEVDIVWYNTAGGVDVIIPSTINGAAVTSIGYGAFANYSDSEDPEDPKINSVDIPDSVIDISGFAFSNNNLTNLKIPDSVKVIDGESAFADNALTDLTIGNKVTTIGALAFKGNNLTSVTIPDSVTFIGRQAFSGLTEGGITLGQGVTSYYIYASGSLQGHIATPPTALDIAQLVADGKIPGNVTAIDGYAFGESNLTSLIIPETVISIGAFAFDKNNLTGVTIPDSVKTVGNGAFANNKLSSLTIDNGITNIGFYTFGNNALTTVLIPDSVTTIDYDAFSDNNLTSITIGANVSIAGDSSMGTNTGFKSFYDGNGKVAGTYEYIEESWTGPESIDAVLEGIPLAALGMDGVAPGTTTTTAITVTGSSIQVSSSNTSVAAVTVSAISPQASGETATITITAIGTGTATITVTAQGINGGAPTSDAFNVNVTMAGVTTPSASLADVTIAGMRNQAITAKDIIITVANDSFYAIANNQDHSAWITNLPAGLIAKTKDAVVAGGTEITLTVSGTPTAALTEAISITLPAYDLQQSSSDLTVTTNAAAFFAIDPYNNAALSQLDVSPGNLNPVFASGTTSYSVVVSSATSSIDVTAALSDGTGASMQINGTAQNSGAARTIALQPAGQLTNILIRVTAEDNVTTRDYTISVNRLAPPLSSDAFLNDLMLSPGELDPEFDRHTLLFDVAVEHDVESVQISAMLSDREGASMMVNNEQLHSDEGKNIALEPAGTTTTLIIEVTAEDEITTRTYTITVNRAAAPRSEAGLSYLFVDSSGLFTILQPSFDQETTDYIVETTYEVASIDVTAHLQDWNASMTLNGAAVENGVSKTVVLNEAGTATAITIVVTAEDEVTTRTYIIIVHRSAPPPGKDASLSTLFLSDYPLNPAFDKDTTDYQVSVEHDVESVTLTAGLSDAKAIMTINGVFQADGTAKTITLREAGRSTSISVVVTAEDHTTTRAYTITVQRTALPNSDAALSSLNLIEGSLNPEFAPDVFAYEVEVDRTVAYVSVLAVLADHLGASMTINNTPQLSGSTKSISLGEQGTSTTIEIVVNAEDQITTKTYTIIVKRDEPPSSDASLSALTVSTGTLNPEFDPDINAYEVEVTHDTDNIDVSATLSDADGAVLIINHLPQAGGVARNITLLSPGSSTTIRLEVLAADRTSRIYTITVNRAPVPPRNDADLIALRLLARKPDNTLHAGTLNPEFDPETTTYEMQVDYNIESISVLARVSDPSVDSLIINNIPHSSRAYQDNDGNRSSYATISLNAPGTATTINIEVTAQDETTVKTYTVTVNRAETPPPIPIEVVYNPAPVAGETHYTAFVSALLLPVDPADYLYDHQGPSRGAIKWTRELPLFHTFYVNGSHTIVYYDAHGNRGEKTVEVDWIDVTPRARVMLSNTEKTRSNVTAWLLPVRPDRWTPWNDRGFTITNNNGNAQYVFNENGSFTFEFEDNYGNKNSKTVAVDWILTGQPILDRFVYYHFGERLEPVPTNTGTTIGIYVRDDENSEPYRLQQTFRVTENGEHQFQIQHWQGQTFTYSLYVDWIDREPPNLEIEQSTQEATAADVLLAISVNEAVNLRITDLLQGLVYEGPLNEEQHYQYVHPVGANCTLRIEAGDLAGNKSEQTITIDNINKTPPQLIYDGPVSFAAERESKDEALAMIMSLFEAVDDHEGDLTARLEAVIEKRAITERGDELLTYKFQVANQAGLVAESEEITLLLVTRYRPEIFVNGAEAGGRVRVEVPPDDPATLVALDFAGLMGDYILKIVPKEIPAAAFKREGVTYSSRFAGGRFRPVNLTPGIYTIHLYDQEMRNKTIVLEVVRGGASS